MKTFTYRDYIKSIHRMRLNAVMQVAEDDSNYGENKNTHEKIAKLVLKNESETINFINKFLNNQFKIKENELIKYESNFIKKKYKSKKIDLIYKIQKREIFFIIEHASKIDEEILNTLTSCCVDIIYERNKSWTNVQRRIEYPIVIPIVIYTGEEKWEISPVSNQLAKSRSNNEIYNLIEINNMSINKLLQKDSLFGCAMILEKAKNSKDLLKKAKIVENHIRNPKLLESFKKVFIYTIKTSMEESIKKEIIEKVEIKIGNGVEKDLSCIQERLTEEFQKEIKRECEKIIKEFTKFLVLKHVSEDVILENERISKKQLLEVKKELRSNKN